METKETLEHIPSVKLKSFLGIPPKIYVSIIWISLFLAILTLVLPWVFSPKSSLEITSLPSGTPVFWRDTFIGHTPLKIKISSAMKGKGTLKFERKNFKIKEIPLNLSSFPFPLSFLGGAKLKDVQLSLDEGLNKDTLLKDYLEDLSFWAARGSSNSSRPNLDIFSRFYNDFLYDKNLLEKFLQKSISLVSTYDLWKDYWKTFSLVFSETTDSDDFKNWLKVCERFNLPQRSVLFFLSIQNPSKKSSLLKNSQFVSLINSLKEETLNLHSDPFQRLEYNPIFKNYILISSRIANVSLNLPETLENERILYRVKIPNFYISKYPVTKADMKVFLEENPQWRPDQKGVLEKLGLADENYLSFIDDPSSDQEPATFTPFPLAREYAQWYTQKYLKNTNFEACLPSTFEWQLAAKSLSEDPKFSLNPNLGSWYWMRDPFSASAKLFATETYPYGIDESLNTFERPIRSLPKKDYQITETTSASLPFHWSGPHISFYLVLKSKGKSL